MISQRLTLSVNLTVWLLCATTQEAHAWWSGAGGEAHRYITRDALTNASISVAEYPDLRFAPFKTQLMNASDEESHDIPDENDTQLWMPPAETWFTAGRTEDGLIGALSVYTNYDFNGAYMRIGYELHLVQDTRVPAHIRFCYHGGIWKTDSLEGVAENHFEYGIPTEDWSFQSTDSEKTRTFQYWLSDNMDDDNKNEKADPDDEVDQITRKLIPDGFAEWGVAITDWGTYGQPREGLWNGKVLEELPGRNEGIDYYVGSNTEEGSNGDHYTIVQGQLTLAHNDTLKWMKLRSEQLPPLVPDNAFGSPSISLKIFGPNKPVVVSFTALENRKPKVFVSVLAGSAGIKDVIHNKVWDGGANATIDLLPWSLLPWGGLIISNWNGDTGAGQIADGNHVISIQVSDQDGNSSEKRTRSVKFDKTPPEATITFRNNPKVSYP
ncbi:MAG: hypothetical protein WCJ02_02745 [bacterium]